MESSLYVVIMAGGRGERFWPQSRLERPKHLLPIVGDKAMLTQTVERLSGLVPPDNIFIITNSEQAAAVRDICPQVPPHRVISEPVGRDTAPAVALATLLVRAENPDATFAILPADHVIHDVEAFQTLLRAAFSAAKKHGGLFTIGIQPNYPATGYGYIQKGEAMDEVEGQPVFAVEAFVEKPALEVAEAYLATGNYFWNAGMFVWTVDAIWKAVQSCTPELAAALEPVAAVARDQEKLDAVLADIYPALTKVSVDYAILEKADKVFTIPSTFDWDDVGEWPAVKRHFPADDSGNVQQGPVYLLDSKDTLVLNHGGPFTAVLGVDNLIVVQTADATLICPRDRAQDIKKLVTELRDKGHQALL